MVENNWRDAPFVPWERLVILDNGQDGNIFKIRIVRSYRTLQRNIACCYPPGVRMEHRKGVLKWMVYVE